MLRLVLSAIVLLSVSAPALAERRRKSYDDVYVGGHTRRDGKRVEPHYKSRSNSNKWDNYDYSGGEKYNKSRRSKGYDLPNPGRYSDDNPKNDSPYGE